MTSAVLLAGLVLNSRLGRWWADAGAALVIAGIAIREGISAWRAATSAAPSRTQPPQPTAQKADDCCAPPPSSSKTPEEQRLPMTAKDAGSGATPEGSGCCAGYESETPPQSLTVNIRPSD
ncbi:hypothetical protein [Pseudarthrobacter sp. CC4]|uniref:hypothetical protein n=1 Tax=Pseudarthrobacter sp. CC4 TaxID=3029190 RepID=UPI003BA0EF62